MIWPLLFFLASLSAQEDMPAKIQQIQSGLVGIASEVEQLEQYTAKIKEREGTINDFRVNFGDLITRFATGGTYNIHFQTNKRQLDQLEAEGENWLAEAKARGQKVDELLAILEQARRSYEEGLKLKRRADLRAYGQLARQAKGHIEKLENIAGRIEEHQRFLQNFQGDTEKWKSFLADKIRKGAEHGLFKWRPFAFYLAPLDSLGKLKSDLVRIKMSVKAFDHRKFYQENARLIGFRLLIVLGIAVALFRLLSLLQRWPESAKYGLIDLSLADILSVLARRKITPCLCALFIFVLKDAGPLSLNPYPTHLALALNVLILATLWVRAGHPVIKLFVAQSNRPMTFPVLPLLLFILTHSTQNFFALDSDLFYFVNNLLLGLISFKVLQLCLNLRFDERRQGKSNEWAIFLHSTKIFISVFAGALLLSSVLEIIGLANLGRSIKAVIEGNIALFGVTWVLYQALSYGLNCLRWQASGQQFIDFFKSLLGVSFLATFSLLLLQSWHEAIFVFGDFWNISLFTSSNYRFTIDKPVKLLACYYILRFAYLVTVHSLDSFLLEKFNIADKHLPNIATIIRYAFILLFFLLGAGIVGATWKNLVLLASALGVGIGFGLQNIVNNFISGIILLFERPIRVGDVIEVDNSFLKVKQIGIRSTLVESLDNSTIIIPNSEILSNKLTNWTLTDNIIAIRCQVGVAYGTDTKLVASILSAVAAANAEVLKTPTPQVWFDQFADSSLNFTLKVWINRPLHKFIIHSELMHEINAKLKDHGVTIPFPQRDVHLYQT